MSRDVEKMAFTWNKEKSAEALNAYIKEDGVQIIELSPEDQKKVAKAFRADYLDHIAKVSPKYGVQLKKVLEKYAW